MSDTFDPAKVEHLRGLLNAAAGRSFSRKDHATWLLTHGVDVQLPAEPDYPVGTTGTATTDLFTAHGFWASHKDDEYVFWFVDADAHGDYVHAQRVTDFIPDVILTPERVEELVTSFEKTASDLSYSQPHPEVNDAWLDAAKAIRQWAADQGVS